MRPAPTVAPNKYNLHGRVQEVEVVASNALTEVKRAHERIDHQPPRGEKGNTGDRGQVGRTGDAGRDGKDGAAGRDAVGIPGLQGRAGLDGAPGKDAPRREELETLLTEQRRDFKALRAEISAFKNELAVIRAAVVKEEAYLDFLRLRRAAREAAKQQ